MARLHTGFGFRLQHAMAIRRIKATELARRMEDLGVGCSPTCVSHWMHGRSVPPMWKLVPLAHALHVPLRRLITDVP